MAPTAKRTRPDLSVSNLPDKEQATGTMARRELFPNDEEPEDEPMDLALRGTKEGVAATMNQMQRVKVIPRNPELHPLTEQRTCVLPVTFYLSMNMLNHKTPVPLKIRVNNHYDILKNSTLTAQVVNTSRNRGLSNDYAFQLPFLNDSTGSMNGPELIPFPCTVVGTTAATATTSSHGNHVVDEFRPAMRTYYDRVWRAYANYKTEYKISILNAHNHLEDLQNVKLLTKLEQYTSTQAGTGNTGLIPQDRPLDQAMKWGLTEHNIEPRNVNTNSSDYTIINGTWTPMKAQQLNVFNDEDKKVWIAAGAENGLVVEDLTILGYKHDMFPVAPRVTRDHEYGTEYNADGTTVSKRFQQFTPYGAACINLKVELKYYCVYKDLKRDIRYQHYGDEDRSLMMLHDLYQKPRNPEYVPNTSPNNTL
jgi:hypothetical protein